MSFLWSELRARPLLRRALFNLLALLQVIEATFSLRAESQQSSAAHRYRLRDLRQLLVLCSETAFILRVTCPALASTFS